MKSNEAYSNTRQPSDLLGHPISDKLTEIHSGTESTTLSISEFSLSAELNWTEISWKGSNNRGPWTLHHHFPKHLLPVQMEHQQHKGALNGRCYNAAMFAYLETQILHRRGICAFSNSTISPLNFWCANSLMDSHGKQTVKSCSFHRQPALLQSCFFFLSNHLQISTAK